jgi:hypothetical protein
MSDLEAGTDVTGAASISPNDPKRTSLVEQLCDRLGALHREGLTLLLAEQSIPLALGIADYAYVLQTGRIALEGPIGRTQTRPACAGDLSRDQRRGALIDPEWMQGTLSAIGRCCRGPLMAKGRGICTSRVRACCKR